MEMDEYLTKQAKMIDNEIATYLRKKPSERYIEKLLGRANYKYDPEAIGKSILEPSWYIFNLGGKRWRPILTLLFIEAFGKDPDEYVEFSIIPEVIHNGTLVHDDIEDGSETRRNAPAVHIKYGIDIATNLADFMYFFPALALTRSAKLSEEVKNRALASYVENLTRVTLGQGTDIAWHRGLVDVETINEEKYLQMAIDKTGVLSRFACELAGIIAGQDDKTVRAVGHFGASIGLAFQLKDDLMNITEGKVAQSKGGVGDDISEGKITLIVIRALKKLPGMDKKRLLQILAMHTKDRKLINEAISIIETTDAKAYAEQMQNEILSKAWAAVDKILKPSEAKEKIKALTDFLVTRSR